MPNSPSLKRLLASRSRLLPAALALALSWFAAGQTAAQDGAQNNAPTSGPDRALLSACLRESIGSPRACIGTIAVPCARTGAGGARPDMEVSCVKRETLLWRERLDAASGAYAQALDSGQRSRFAALQRSWEGYVAQKCAFLGEMQPPARMATMQAGCDLQEVANRAIEIERALRNRQSGAGNTRNRPPRIER
jgi:uncharacterized protein YecT (DUF1311 family)